MCLGNNIKQRLRQLEQLDEVFAKSGLNPETLSRDDREAGYQQQHNTITFPVSQPLTTQPDNNCCWLAIAGQNKVVTSDMDSNQFKFDLNSPHTNQPSQQFDYFAHTSDQDQNAILAFDRQTSGEGQGQITIPSGIPPLSQSPPALARTRSDTAIQSMASISIQSDVCGNLTSSEPQAPSSRAYRMPTPPTSDQSSTTEGRLRSSSSSTIHTTFALQSYTGSGSSSGSGSGCTTPLHQAAANGHVQIVRFLVMRGANVLARNESSQTVLHLAAAQGHDGVIEHILQSEGEEIKASIGWIDDQGFTALHRAAAGGHEECVRVLVEAGAEIESSKQ